MKIRILVFFLLFLGQYLNAQSLNNPVSGIDIRLGFDGYIIPNRWTPIRIIADANVGAYNIEIIRRDYRSGNMPPEIFSYIGGTIETSFFSDDSCEKIIVRIKKENLVAAEQQLDTTKNHFPGHLILTGGLSSQVQYAVKQALYPDEPVLVVPVEIRDLPNCTLNYDGVSCLIMEDPGLTLNPGQLSSLREWLSGGGRFVVYSLKDYRESILQKLISLENLANSSSNITANIGLGKVVFFTQSIENTANSREPLFWKKILNLKLYTFEDRLIAGKIFTPAKIIPSAKINKWGMRFILLLFFSAWTALFILSVIFIRKKLLIVLSGILLLSIIISIPLSLYLRGTWMRGASSHIRGVILPDKSGLFLNADVQAISPEYYIVYFGETETAVSPWTVNIGIGDNETGRIHPGTDTEWRHLTNTALYAVREGSTDDLDLVGFLPILRGPDKTQESNDNDIEKLINSHDEKYLWKNKTLFEYQTNKENELSEVTETPEWLKYESSWLNWLSENYPGWEWMIGKGDMPFLDFKIMNNKITNIFWAYPLFAASTPPERRSAQSAEQIPKDAK